MAKTFVVFGATGLQGGEVAKEILKAGEAYTVIAVTRNTSSPKAQGLASAGVQLVQADLNDIESVKHAVKGAHFIYAVTDFMGAGNTATEIQQGHNLVDAASGVLDTLEAFVWSGLPDARKQAVPYQNVQHFNSKRAISEYARVSPIRDLVTEIWIGPYYQNFKDAWQVYGPQKGADGAWSWLLPVKANTRIPFKSIHEVGRLVETIVKDPAKFRAKTVSVVSPRITVAEMLKAWNKVVGVNATLRPLSTNEYEEHLTSTHVFPEEMACSLAENLSCYRDNAMMWIEGTDINLTDILLDLESWQEYVDGEEWAAFFRAAGGKQTSTTACASSHNLTSDAPPM